MERHAGAIARGVRCAVSRHDGSDQKDQESQQYQEPAYTSRFSWAHLLIVDSEIVLVGCYILVKCPLYRLEHVDERWADKNGDALRQPQDGKVVATDKGYGCAHNRQCQRDYERSRISD